MEIYIFILLYLLIGFFSVKFSHMKFEEMDNVFQCIFFIIIWPFFDLVLILLFFNDLNSRKLIDFIFGKGKK